VFKGCNTAGFPMNAKVRVIGPETPTAVRSTDDFGIEIYRNFDVASYTFTNPIVTGAQNIPSTMLTSGLLTNGVFYPLLEYIQI
jgi:hypothetical protein